MLYRTVLCAALLYVPAVFAQTDAAAFPKQDPGTQPPVLTGTAPLTEQELKDGWIRLFDGVSLYGWTISQGKYSVNNGVIVSDPKQTGVLRFNVPFIGTLKSSCSEKQGADWKNLSSPDTLQAVKTGIVLKDGQFQDVKVQPQKTKLLFDGKTLNGWKLHGQAKAVVEDGAIHLTGGSGSLESEGQYGNFLLQLEYKTDKPVNSGVFFRCIPGEMMNGYECQIFNNPPADDYKKFIGTDTGGIFRRQVGRNVGAKDGQWNYLTVLAHGDRIAVWVNGIQVSDWTDTRKADANPRKGKRTEAGTLQFQGHDPTTDILLRNIRISD